MLPEILPVAEKYGLLIYERSRGKREVRAKCPFCKEDSKSGKERKFYLSLNTKDQVFKCWYCGESGGVFRFIALLEGTSESEVIERYRKGKRQQKLHPAEKLTSRQLQMIGFQKPIWNKLKRRDYRYYERTCHYVWSEWRHFIQTEKYFLFRILVSAIENGNYLKAVAIIKEREQKIGVPLLEPILKTYSLSVWPKWAKKTVEIGDVYSKAQKEVKRREENSTARISRLGGCQTK